MALWILEVVLCMASIPNTFAKVTRSDLDLFNEMAQKLPFDDCDSLMINSPIQGKLDALYYF